MSRIVCSNNKCRYLSKRKSKFINGYGDIVYRHTCKIDVLTMISFDIHNYYDENVKDMLGYVPMECLENKKGD